MREDPGIEAHSNGAKRIPRSGSVGHRCNKSQSPVSQRRPLVCSGSGRFCPALPDTPPPSAVSELRLKLFVAGDSPRAREAASNLARICQQMLPDEVVVETVDVLEHPDLAEAYRILTTPTVLREAPPPVRRATGDLGDADQLCAALALYPNRPTT